MRELKRLLEARTRQWHTESARAQRVFGVLVELASELCMAEFDAELKRRGDLLQGDPNGLKDFIVAQIKPRLNAGALAGNRELAALHQALQREYAGLQTAHERLSITAQQAEREVTALRQQLAAREAASVRTQRDAGVGRGAPEASPAQVGARHLGIVSPRPLATPPEVLPTPAPELLPTATEGAPEPPADLGRVDELIRLVAATGLARLSKIREKLATVWRIETRSASVRNAVNAAKDAGFIKLFEAQADWQGAAKAVFVELTAAGSAHARALGVEPAVSEIAEGVRRGFTLEHLNLILRAADILDEEKHQTVKVLPGRVMLPDGLEYRPMLSAIDPKGQQIYVECEREKADGVRDKRWRLAALAGGGKVWLLTTTPVMQAALVSEINLAKLNGPFTLAAGNVVDYTAHKPGKGGGLWTYTG